MVSREPSVLPSRRSVAGRRAAGRGAALTRFDSKFYKLPDVSLLCGVDEAGRGALAGPVCVGAVVLARECGLPAVDDSKVLTPPRRAALYAEIMQCASAAAVGWASAEEVDRINVLEATYLAARRALAALVIRPHLVLADALKPQALHPEEFGCKVVSIIDGDAKSRAVAAASIIAKVTRDRWMCLYDAEYPGYGLAGHKGYGARTHVEALERMGSTTLHRHTFQGVDFFDRPHVRSRTLTTLLSELETGTLAGEAPEALWWSRAWRLPACEERDFRKAWEEKYG